MAFYFSKRKTRPREPDDVGELNIVPYLDIMMNLIMFMLLSMTGLAVFGILNVNAPSYGGPSAGVGETTDQPKLLLSVLISKKGYFIAGAGAVLGQETPTGEATAGTEGEPTVPKKGDGTYDTAALTAKMVQIKTAFPSESKVIVGAEADISYETLIDTMDAIRETGGGERKILFSDVTLAAM
ncbi:MAG TPA: biopolymer transporter ExbD [Myxococcales bacterium]|nr:biopolymer transporter ExbD [Myxococcales bacterium]